MHLHLKKLIPHFLTTLMVFSSGGLAMEIPERETKNPLEKVAALIQLEELEA
jgi:hypothetical protein